MTTSLIRRGIPHVPGRVPLLGDIRNIDRRRPLQNEMALAASLGPIYERKVVGLHFIYAAGGRLAAQCSDEQHWERELYGPVTELRRFMPRSLFTAESSDPLWGQAHRIFTPAFTQTAMRRYHHAMQWMADDLVAEWSGGCGVVDVHSAMTRATGEAIGRAGFGRNLGLFGATADGAASRAFFDAMAAMLRMTADAGSQLPGIGILRRWQREPTVRRHIKLLNGFADDIVADRVQHPTDDEDLLNLMLTVRDPETGQRLPPENLRAQLLTFLVAGAETTAALLEVALHFIAADRQLQDELRAGISARGGFDYQAVTGMRLVRHVLNECLRLWPPVPGYLRKARSDQNLGGYRIPAGQTVFVLALAAQRDREVWGPDAGAFDPYRFEPDRLRANPERFFQPWGVGPRSCIGRQFAFQQATLLIARILSDFELTTDGAPLVINEHGTIRPAPYRLNIRRLHGSVEK
ncbi:cytochrome P450 [Nocardia sp. NPDC051832]|uniref:cytochrome P450 n=1 Tax=Nocardia sp. NPDC051832 TaxID=3155673 RepID=UPI00343EA8A1